MQILIRKQTPSSPATPATLLFITQILVSYEHQHTDYKLARARVIIVKSDNHFVKTIRSSVSPLPHELNNEQEVLLSSSAEIQEGCAVKFNFMINPYCEQLTFYEGVNSCLLTWKFSIFRIENKCLISLLFGRERESSEVWSINSAFYLE